MKIISKVLIILGILLVLSSLSLVGVNYYNSLNAEKSSNMILESIEKIQNAPLENDEIKTLAIAGNNYIGTITIPSLNINLPINESYSFDKLKKSPCLYYGMLNANNFVICAHGYEKQFRNIGKLQNEDTIIITDLYNNSTYYKVELIEEIDALDIDKMLESNFDLTLFTCDTSGLKRITVRCNKQLAI